MKGARLACSSGHFRFCVQLCRSGLAFHTLDRGAALNPRLWEIQIITSHSLLASFHIFTLLWKAVHISSGKFLLLYSSFNPMVFSLIQETCHIMNLVLLILIELL